MGNQFLVLPAVGVIAFFLVVQMMSSIKMFATIQFYAKEQAVTQPANTEVHSQISQLAKDNTRLFTELESLKQNLRDKDTELTGVKRQLNTIEERRQHHHHNHDNVNVDVDDLKKESKQTEQLQKYIRAVHDHQQQQHPPSQQQQKQQDHESASVKKQILAGARERRRYRKKNDNNTDKKKNKKKKLADTTTSFTRKTGSFTKKVTSFTRKAKATSRARTTKAISQATTTTTSEATEATTKTTSEPVAEATSQTKTTKTTSQATDTSLSTSEVVLPSSQTSAQTHTNIESVAEDVVSPVVKDLNNNNNKNIDTTKCTAPKRRDLARRGEDASDAEWKDMTECMLHDYNHNKMGHFFHHISKSGGTSVGIMLMNQKTCFGHYTGKSPWVEKSMGFASQWYRNKNNDGTKIKMPAFGMVGKDKSWLNGARCSDVEGKLRERKRMAIMSEAVIPYENDQRTHGGCDNMINSIMFRQPMARLLSHYRHLHFVCKYPEFKTGFIGKTDKKKSYFDVDFMTSKFDIVSDNYYTRSLVGRGLYDWEGNSTVTSISQRDDAWTTIFPMANASLHAFDWIMLMNNFGKTEEGEHRDLVLKYGLGLRSKLKRTNVGRANDNYKILLTPEHEEQLKKLNSLDYKLWEEAKELNRLDRLSLERMMPYLLIARNNTPAAATTEDDDNNNDSTNCCGHVCPKWDDKPPPSSTTTTML